MPEHEDNPAPSAGDVAKSQGAERNEASGRPLEPVDNVDKSEISVDRIATGGAALGLAPDGRVAFVQGAIPGERVKASIVREHRKRLEAVVASPDDVIMSSADRIDPVCRHVQDGCGGCDWQHIAEQRQRELRRDVVADCLRRLAGFDHVDIRLGPPLPSLGYRTTVRAAVVDGRAAYRKAASHDTVTIDACPIAHPLVEEVLVEGYFAGASEVTVRAGANTGERMVIVAPNAEGIRVPDGIAVVGVDELDAGARPHYHEEVGGIRLQVSARSFFQCRPDGAGVLAELVSDALADAEGDLLDGYCGVGLFGALAGIGRSVIAVESDPSAVADAEWNLRKHGNVIKARFDKWEAQPASVAVVDPARSGLRTESCDRLVATGAKLIALVSCDPASLARDASLLAQRGYSLDHVTVVDLFGQTSHIETVAKFTQDSP